MSLYFTAFESNNLRMLLAYVFDSHGYPGARKGEQVTLVLQRVAQISTLLHTSRINLGSY